MELRNAKWVRFSDYIVVPRGDREMGDVIVPSDDAAGEWFEPWRRAGESPYLALFDVVRQLHAPEPTEPYETSPAEQATLIAWFRSWGSLRGPGIPIRITRKAPRLGEPVALFIAAARELQDAVFAVRAEQEPFDQVRTLGRLVAMAGSALDGDGPGDGFAPSLLETFAAMALLDTVNQRQLVQCETCGRWFGAWNPRSRYCSDTCKWTGHKRVQRARKRARRETTDASN